MPWNKFVPVLFTRFHSYTIQMFGFPSFVCSSSSAFYFLLHTHTHCLLILFISFLHSNIAKTLVSFVQIFFFSAFGKNRFKCCVVCVLFGATLFLVLQFIGIFIVNICRLID